MIQSIPESKSSFFLFPEAVLLGHTVRHNEEEKIVTTSVSCRLNKNVPLK